VQVVIWNEIDRRLRVHCPLSVLFLLASVDEVDPS